MAKRNPHAPNPSNPDNQAPKPPSQKLNLPSKEVLNSLPDDVRISVVEAASFVGPLPPPSMYKAYDEVHPGSANRILTMAKKEQDQRINFENTALQATIKNDSKAQLFGFILGVLYIGGLIFLAMNGNQIVASSFAFVIGLFALKSFFEKKK